MTVTMEHRHNPSPAWGTMLYLVPCPEGSVPIGGGGFRTRTDVDPDYYADYDDMFAYDDGTNIGWAVKMTVPQGGTWTVDVYALCRSTS